MTDGIGNFRAGILSIGIFRSAIFCISAVNIDALKICASKIGRLKIGVRDALFALQNALCEAAAVATQPGAANADFNASPMLRILSRDTGAQFALCTMLGGAVVSVLHSTSLSWREWINRAPLPLSCSQSFTAVTAARLPRCAWIRRSLVSTSFTAAELELFSDVELVTFMRAQHTLSSALLALAACPRLTSLTLIGPAPVLPEMLAGMGNSLTELIFQSDMRLADMRALFRSVGVLRQLRLLCVNNAMERPHDCDFSALPTLPRLTAFALTASDHKLTFRCSAAQVKCLAACTALESINAGCWSADERDEDDDDEPLPSCEQQIEEGIATLVRGVLARPALAAAAGDCRVPASLTRS